MSQLETFWENIDTHWGGRLKTSGRVSRTDDDTIFEQVGTGTYWDGSFNFRLINETFFSDSVFTDIAYELIGAGGDTARKTSELKELFPDLPTNVFFLGTRLDDDRRLMDLTDTIVDKDSYFLVQRLDRLYLALMRQWGSIKVGRQAITWALLYAAHFFFGETFFLHELFIFRIIFHSGKPFKIFILCPNNSISNLGRGIDKAIGHCQFVINRYYS
jgi:hypothetical protein